MFDSRNRPGRHVSFVVLLAVLLAQIAGLSHANARQDIPDCAEGTVWSRTANSCVRVDPEPPPTRETPPPTREVPPTSPPLPTREAPLPPTAPPAPTREALQPTDVPVVAPTAAAVMPPDDAILPPNPDRLQTPVVNPFPNPPGDILGDVFYTHYVCANYLNASLSTFQDAKAACQLEPGTSTLFGVRIYVTDWVNYVWPSESSPSTEDSPETGVFTDITAEATIGLQRAPMPDYAGSLVWCESFTTTPGDGIDHGLLAVASSNHEAKVPTNVANPDEATNRFCRWFSYPLLEFPDGLDAPYDCKNFGDCPPMEPTVPVDGPAMMPGDDVQPVNPPPPPGETLPNPPPGSVQNSIIIEHFICEAYMNPSLATFQEMYDACPPPYTEGTITNFTLTTSLGSTSIWTDWHGDTYPEFGYFSGLVPHETVAVTRVGLPEYPGSLVTCKWHTISNQGNTGLIGKLPVDGTHTMLLPAEVTDPATSESFRCSWFSYPLLEFPDGFDAPVDCENFGNCPPVEPTVPVLIPDDPPFLVLCDPLLPWIEVQQQTCSLETP